MTFLDTSVVVRYLTASPADFFEKAKQIIDTEHRLTLTDVALAEVAFVLSSVYKVPREVVVDTLIGFVQRQNISVFSIDKEIVVKALLFCRPSGRVSMADALIWAAANSSDGGLVTIYSFDKRFPSDGILLKAEI